MSKLYNRFIKAVKLYYESFIIKAKIKALQKLHEKVACLHVDIFNDTDLVLCILSKCDWMNIS